VDFDNNLHSQSTENNQTISASDADIYAEQLMSILNPKERVVITLSCAAGMSHGEIEAVTQMPLGSIKSLIQRAKTKSIKYANQDLTFKQAHSWQIPYSKIYWFIIKPLGDQEFKRQLIGRIQAGERKRRSIVLLFTFIGLFIRASLRSLI